MAPTLKVFLDVDDHPSKSGLIHPKAKFPHEFVEFSDVVLAILAGKYGPDGARSSFFHSKPCLNELKWAVDYGKPVVWLLETNPDHGGVSLEVHGPRHLPHLPSWGAALWPLTHCHTLGACACCGRVLRW